jgi:2-polyprenyl-6-methoxyphenol hydroxylase-like FAD-dependent oxidoreductase
MANRMRHYDRSAPLPGFIAVGDAVSAFNPVYGQGMSTSAACAAILASTMDAHGVDPERLPRAFFRAQARFLAQPWSMATGADFLFPETIGKRPLASHVFHPYFKAVFETALEDKAMRLQLGEVFNLIRPASALFDPRIGARAIMATARRSLSPRAPVPTTPPFS